MSRPVREVSDQAGDEKASMLRTLVSGMFAEAVARHRDGQGPVAEAVYRAVLALLPGHAEAAYNLGLLLHAERRLPEAAAAYRYAIAARADYPEAYCNLGVALADDGKSGEALAAYEQAIKLQPGFAMAHCNMGVVLKGLGRLDDAEAAYRRAISGAPDNDFAFANLAAVLLDQGRPEDALIACRRALALRPEMELAHFNLATALKTLCRVEEAEASFRRALALNPAFVEAHFSLAQTLLVQGKFAEGAAEYEWRWNLKDYAWLTNIHGVFTQPRWDGGDLAGRTILIYAEQGLGDAIQYVRYLPRVVEAGGAVVLAVHPPLRALFASVEGVTLVGLDTVPLPPFDVHCPLLSLPLLLGTTLETVPSAVPYLRAQTDRTAYWRERAEGAGKKVGIVWAGNPTQTGDRFRSPRLGAVMPLFEVPGITFVGLQVGPGRQDLAQHKLPPNVLDLGAEISDLADTAAIMSGLDLIISSCTAPLHLAGALGVPVWGLIPFSPHFAWLLGREDSVWYPTLRLYRQEVFGTDWSAVVGRVATDLARFVAGG